MKLISIIFTTASSLSWLSIGLQNTENVCESGSLGQVQRRLCQKNSRFNLALSHAATETVNSCQEMMATERWGCHSIKALPSLKRELKEATTESAFVHALSSAQLVASLTRLCESGTIGKCSSEQIRQFATEFTDIVPLQKRRKQLGTIEVHNLNIGRKVALASKTQICKCHGQSGSCTQKTCWETSPDSKIISAKLAKKYETAARISTDVNNAIPAQISQFVARDRLLYTQTKQDFCNETKGRECDPFILGTGSCEKLCCRRGFIHKTSNEVKEECRFIWPAQIECVPKIITIKKYLCA
jgi:hypothetical protein